MADRRNIDVMAANALRQIPDPIPQAAGTGLTLVPFAPRHLDRKVITAMRAAALDVNRDGCIAVMQDAILAGIGRDDIADFYIPQLARELGDDWCSDGLSFAAVTIGVSRLQAMLRELGPEWAGDQSSGALDHVDRRTGGISHFGRHGAERAIAPQGIIGPADAGCGLARACTETGQDQL